MRVSGVQLTNFRNYEALTVRPAPGLNFLYGANGSGKTNFLEALYFSLCGISFRTLREEEVIGPAGESCKIWGALSSAVAEVETRVEIAVGRKRLFLNEKEVGRSAFPGPRSVLLFLPRDINVTAGPPAERRRFFDRLFSLVVPGYAQALRNYQRLLEQRNALLKGGGERNAHPLDLGVWTEAFAAAASNLYHLRLEGLAAVASYAVPRYRSLTGKRLSLRYVSSVRIGTDRAATQANLLAALASVRNEELRYGQTLVGPSRDDFLFLVEGRDLRSSGSRGEQRAAVLALKAAEAELLERERGEEVVYLLDDLFSEFDEHRRAALLEWLQDRQAFVTATDKLPLARACFFRVENGQVITGD